MIRIAPQETSALEFHFIAHAFQLLLTQPVGFLDASADLVLDSKGDLDRSRCHGTQQHFVDRGVHFTPANRLARLSCATDDFLRADVVRYQSISELWILLIARAHPAGASAANHVTLQERRALAGH